LIAVSKGETPIEFLASKTWAQALEKGGVTHADIEILAKEYGFSQKSCWAHSLWTLRKLSHFLVNLGSAPISHVGSA
jgi:hypothetical protein